MKWHIRDLEVKNNLEVGSKMLEVRNFTLKSRFKEKIGFSHEKSPEC